jgi:hypothetical protein
MSELAEELLLEFSDSEDTSFELSVTELFATELAAELVVEDAPAPVTLSEEAAALEDSTWLDVIELTSDEAEELDDTEFTLASFLELGENIIRSTNPKKQEITILMATCHFF